MAKYIGTYATSGDVQTALDNQELSRPFIAYTTDNEKVIYGPTAVKAEVGDIVVYSVADDLLHYIKQADYNTTSYPAASYVPVGVVAYPQTDDAILGPTGEITFIGLNWLDKNNPDNGNSDYNASFVNWGYGNFDIPQLINYTSTGTAITDMNGKANTEAVLQYATAQTTWKTDSAITDVDEVGYYPAFECAWRYHTSGTVQGDWYIPACGQVYYITKSDVLDLINESLTILNGSTIVFGSGRNYGASTEASAIVYCGFIGGTAVKANCGKNTTNHNYGFHAHPFCSKLMTRI